VPGGNAGSEGLYKLWFGLTAIPFYLARRDRSYRRRRSSVTDSVARIMRR
jgi:hypothetical protein